MSTRRDAPRKARQEVPIAAGPLRNSHRAALKKIWDERPCLPSATSRKAWACARGIDPTFVNRWFYAQAQKARTLGLELDMENVGYSLSIEGGSPPERLTPSKRDSILYSTTPEGLPELSCYEYSVSSETGLRIPLSPGQSSSPIFGSSFYSPKLTIPSPPGAYGHPPGVERFLFTPPSPSEYKRTAQPLSHCQYFAEGPRTRTDQSPSPVPVSPTPNNCLPPLPLAPKKLRPSRGSHDILNFHIQNDPYQQFSHPTLSPTPMASGYSVRYGIGPRTQEEHDKPNLSTSSDLRAIAAKTSRLSNQKRAFMDDRRTVYDNPNDQTALLPSQTKHRWLHRVHRRSTHTPDPFRLQRLLDQSSPLVDS